MINYSNLYSDTKPEKELYFELGRTLISQSKYRKAIEFLEEAKLLEGADRPNWEIFYLLGDGYKSLSKPKNAFENYIEAAICVKEESDKSKIFQQAQSLLNLTSVNTIKEYLDNRLRSTGLSAADAKVLNELLTHISTLNKKVDSGEKASGLAENEIQQSIDAIQELIGKNEYKAALSKTEEILTKNPDNYEVLFLKLRILIEGQIDLAGATVLFIDEDFGYRKEYDDTTIINKLQHILKDNPDNGNAFYFAAFIGNLMEHDTVIVGEWITKATSLGLKTENEFPSLGLFLLKGEIAEKDEEEKELAGSNFFEAAKCYYWQGNYSTANKYFEKATLLDTNNVEAFNYFADNQLLLSYLNVPPYNDERLVAKAFETWQRSPGKEVKTKNDAWHYIVVARIHEVKYKFETINFYEQYWYAVLYAERALVHNPGDYYPWTYLGRFHRNVELEANSMADFDTAERLKPGDEFLKEEKTILQLNRGDYEKPMALINELKAQEITTPNSFKSFHKSWEGYVYFHDDQKLKEATAIFDDVIKETGSNLFAHQMKLFCHWALNEEAASQKEAKEILELESKFSYPKEGFTFSWAHFILGNTTQAIDILKDLVREGIATAENLNSLAQFYLYAGDIEQAQSFFDRFVRSTNNKRALQELSSSLDSLLVQYKSNHPEPNPSLAAFADKIASWKNDIQKRNDDITREPITIEKELTNQLEVYQFAEGSVPYITIQAGLARIAQERKNYSEAWRIYSNLLKYETYFPEASPALIQIEKETQSSLESARSFIKESRFKEAIECLQQFVPYDTKTSATSQLLFSLAYFGADNKEKSLEYLEAVFSEIKTNPGFQKEVWVEITTHAYNATMTWKFGNFIKVNAGLLSLPVEAGLDENLNENFWNVLINKSSDLYTVVTPIAIEISNDLVSADANSIDWHVIKDLVPSMRNKIESQYGVKTAGVRFRGNDGDLAAGTYVIFLDEVPLVMGTVQKDKLFIPHVEMDLAALGIVGETGYNPVDGKQSVWVEYQFKELLEANNIPYWDDPFDYILAHLESVLVQNLDLFVDIYFCTSYLYDVEGQLEAGYLAALSEAAKNIRTDQVLLPLFYQLMKGLVREKVPLINKSVIVQTFIKAKDKTREVNELVQQTRIALKAELPVNKYNLTSLQLPGETEKNIQAALTTEDAKTFLAMTPENCQEALAEIRDLVSNHTEDHSRLMLVTNDPTLRVHLHKLVELEFPLLEVTSTDELMKK